MRTLIFLLTALLIACNIGTIEVQTFYDNNHKTLKEKHFALKSDTSIKHGLYKHYFENGKLEREGKYVHGEKEGLFKLYDKYGRLRGEYYYETDRPQSIWKDYDLNGKIEKEYTYKDGQMTFLKEYYENGSVSEEGQVLYKGGMFVFKHGDWKEYYESGKFKGEGKLNEGKHVGIWKFYYENGNLKETGEFTGKEVYEKIGLWKYYNENGDLKKEIEEVPYSIEVYKKFEEKSKK